MVSCANRFFYQPDSFVHYPPEKNGLEPTDVWFEAGDGNRLHGWFFAAHKQSAKGTIVQFHGNAQNLTSHYASLVWLTKRGYNLFIFDYRGYGKSPGKPDAEGIYKDGMAALDKAWELHKSTKAKRFVVYGQSLGGIIAARSFADFSHRDDTDLFVADSTFVSYDALAREWLQKFWITWPFSWLGPLLVSDKFGAEAIWPRLKIRLLVIHDLHDPIVGFENGTDLFDLAPGKKDFWVLDKGRHIAIFYLDTPQHRDEFVKTLDAL